MHITKLAVFALTIYGALGGEREIRRDDKWPPQYLIDLINESRHVCIARTGVADESIKEFSDGDYHEDPQLKCYMRCLFEDTKTIDENGEVHLEKIHTHIDRLDEEIQHIARDLVIKCSAQPEGDDECEKAFAYHKCWRMTDPKHYFLL